MKWDSAHLISNELIHAEDILTPVIRMSKLHGPLVRYVQAALLSLHQESHLPVVLWLAVPRTSGACASCRGCESDGLAG